MPRYTRFSVMIISVWLVVAVSLPLLGCSHEDDISGTWKGKIVLPKTGKSLTDLEFFLTRKGNEVTGQMLFTKPGLKLPVAGTFADGKLSLSAPMKNGLSVSISAVRESPKMIRGRAVLDYAIPQQGKQQDQALVELSR